MMNGRRITLALICVVLLVLAGCMNVMGPGHRSSPPLRVKLGQPVAVAQAGEKDLPWGIWQFSLLSQPEPGVLLVKFSQTEDKLVDKVSKIHPAGCAMSTDGGKTWQPGDAREGYGMLCHRLNGDILALETPASREIPKNQLPAPAGVSSNGGGDFYTLRDPLKIAPDLLPRWTLLRKPAGQTQWERMAMTIDDPVGAAISYDPPGKDYAILGTYGTGGNHLLELPDGSLLLIKTSIRLGPDRKPQPKWATYCLRSTDNGAHWKFHGMIACDDANQPLHGYCEPSVTVLPDGSLLAVLRTERGWETNQRTGIMYLAQSHDGGRNWSLPRAINPFGVFPRLLALDNGITVLSFGRPGVNLLFNIDGRGDKWEGLTLLVNEGQRFTRTSGYTCLIPTGPDRFLIAYDQFDYPNAQGEPRKTILVREITVVR